MFAKTETKVVVKGSPAELTFQKDADGNVIGLILRAGTRPELKLLKVK